MSTCVTETPSISTTVELTLECKLSGKRHTVTLSNGTPLHTDILDLRSAKARDAFVSAIAKKFPAIPTNEIQRLLEVEAAAVAKPKAEGTHNWGEELSASLVLRPELFLTPAVCGVVIPQTTLVAGEPKARWALYLQWADGRREARGLEQSLDVGGRRIFFHPIPDTPTAGTLPGWSSKKRKQWLDGEPSVNPVEVFTGLCEAIAYYLDLPQPESTCAVLALWIMLTYFYPAWDAIPYLYAGGPKGSGKSRLFEVLSRLVFRPLCSSNMSAPCLFRTLHNHGGVLILDEAERLKESTPDTLELRSVLLAGYKRGGRASRLEAQGDTFRLIEFDVYGPKALACIAGLPGPLLDRCISIIMFRSPAGSEKPKRRIDEDPARWQSLRDGLYQVALEYGSSIVSLASDTTACPIEISGRDYELWHPIMALARWLETLGVIGLLGLVQDHARRAIEDKADDGVGEMDETLLRALTQLVKDGFRPTAKEILIPAREDEPELLKRFTPKGVATVLARFSLRPKKSHGQKLYDLGGIEPLARIQRVYGVDLGFSPDAPPERPQTTAHVPPENAQNTEDVPHD